MSRASDLLLKTAYRTLRMLPAPCTSAVGAGLGHIYALNAYLRGHLWFKRTISNMEHLAGADQQTATGMAFQLIRNTGRVKAEFAVIDRCRRYVRFSGLDNLKLLTKPAIIVAPHIGNWEIAAAAVVLEGIPITALYDPPKNDVEHKLARETRLRLLSLAPGSKLIPASSYAMRRLVEAAKARENLLIYIDEEKDDLIWNPPLGRELPLRGNRFIVASLALKYDMQIIPIFVKRLNGLNFEICIAPALQMPTCSDHHCNIKSLADQISLDTERIVLSHLTQWFWLPKFRAHRPFSGNLRYIQRHIAQQTRHSRS